MIKRLSVKRALVKAEEQLFDTTIWCIVFDEIKPLRSEIVRTISRGLQIAQSRAKRTFEQNERERFVKIAKKIYEI